MTDEQALKLVDALLTCTKAILTPQYVGGNIYKNQVSRDTEIALEAAADTLYGLKSELTQTIGLTARYNDLLEKKLAGIEELTDIEQAELEQLQKRISDVK